MQQRTDMWFGMSLRLQRQGGQTEAKARTLGCQILFFHRPKKSILLGVSAHESWMHGICSLPAAGAAPLRSTKPAICKFVYQSGASLFRFGISLRKAARARFRVGRLKAVSMFRQRWAISDLRTAIHARPSRLEAEPSSESRGGWIARRPHRPQRLRGIDGGRCRADGKHVLNE